MPWPFSPKYPERTPEYANEDEYDYIIIGGETSGCVLASHLSSSTTQKILLLERGPTNDTYLSRISLLSSNIYSPSSGAKSWFCSPMKHCNDRESLVFRAELLGGGSRVNNEVYTRGTKGDYEEWKEMGCEGWGWKDVEPYFQRMEKIVGEDVKEAERVRKGNAGAMCYEIFWLLKTENETPISILFFRKKLLLSENFFLTICTNTTVHRIEFSDDDGIPLASEAIFGSSDSTSTKTFEAKVKKEVIICSGALGSPQVLMLSGIGPRQHLEEHKIKFIHDLPGVGSNFTDHPSTPVAWEIPISESIIQVAVSPLKAILEFGNFFIRSQSLSEDATGPHIKDSSSPNIEPTPTETSPLQPSNSQNLVPDIELIPLAVSAMDDMEEHRSTFSKIGVFCILAVICSPLYRGSVRLTSPSPHSFPAVDFGIFSNPSDMILALSFGKTMLSSGFPLLRPVTFSSVSQDLDVENGNLEEMDNFIRHGVRNTFHYSSTCRMGSETDENYPGVVDNELRVHGVKGVRIGDASVFPKIVSHHTMAPAAMVATRCAGFVVDAQNIS
ncbi:hypothetical protein BPAE_0069g00020 [Botrytis paeoniae]|uniref:Glucose-methanol-choline oxidoreductase N-terminal domain-containing protein n=1 Tax=Botrytis paeoniae TaxID=278948 RepID=A0A4Z1FRD9_9HELO|nr:hypothetical protein BPAE_0069g00020 [Botrytis paeoniae]